MEAAHYPQSSPAAPARSLASLLVFLLLAGCTSTGGPVASNAAGPASQPFGLGEIPWQEPTALGAKSNDVLMRAIGLVGTPYRYGGNTPVSGFDCSGLVDFVFRDAAGLDLPRSTRELIDLPAPEIDREDLQPGDLLFFSPRGGQVSHIGIYVGEGRFVHAPSEGGTVRLDSLETPYWREAYRSAKRVLH
jgi:cell wall-associated NlpC family hydrolase